MTSTLYLMIAEHRHCPVGSVVRENLGSNTVLSYTKGEKNTN